MGRTPKGETRDKILRFVRDRILAGTPPTVREVQSHFHFKTVQTAREHLDGLIEQGRLEKDANTFRGMRLPGCGSPKMIPLLGEVQAGDLSLAIQEPDGYIPLEKAGHFFALKVRGESMTGAGILPGDIAVVRKQPSAENGDIVVALVGEEATIKTFRRRNHRIELHPHHPDFRPIVSDEIIILGKVIEIRRSLS